MRWKETIGLFNPFLVLSVRLIMQTGDRHTPETKNSRNRGGNPIHSASRPLGLFKNRVMVKPPTTAVSLPMKPPSEVSSVNFCWKKPPSLRACAAEEHRHNNKTRKPPPNHRPATIPLPLGPFSFWREMPGRPFYVMMIPPQTAHLNIRDAGKIRTWVILKRLRCILFTWMVLSRGSQFAWELHENM